MEGENPLRRRCRHCGAVVHDFDAMAPGQRAELLERSEHEKTVCVAQLMPAAAAERCPSGKPVTVGALVVLEPMKWLKPREPFPTRPVHTDRGIELRVFTAGLPAVVEAVRELADEFELAALSGIADHWHLFNPQLDASLDVAVNAVGDETEVVVCVVPTPPRPHRRSTLEFLGSLDELAGAVIGSVSVLFYVMWVELGTFFVIMTSFLCAGLIIAGIFMTSTIPQERRARAIDVWSTKWRQRFWTTLEARLTPPRHYR